jgi:hypothetical protein
MSCLISFKHFCLSEHLPWPAIFFNLDSTFHQSGVNNYQIYGQNAQDEMLQDWRFRVSSSHHDLLFFNFS